MARRLQGKRDEGGVNELVALAKKLPGKLSYASSGNGSPTHLGMELFKDGVELVASTPAELETFMRADMAKWGDVIKTARIRAD